MSVLFVVMAILDWVVAGLYAFDSRWGFAVTWLAAGALWLGAARCMAQARRIRQEIDRVVRGER